jgi:ubiquinone/menaquinone biosynthesis C-methylase UbiE
MIRQVLRTRGVTSAHSASEPVCVSRISELEAERTPFSLRERLASGRVYAVDIQRDLLRRIANEARKRGFSNVDVVWADLEVPRASKLADASLDIALISNVLFQIPDKLPLMREARRIIKPTGHIIIIDWEDSFGGLGPMSEDVVPREAVLALSERAGLSLFREIAPGAYHYGLILKPMPLA